MTDLKGIRGKTVRGESCTLEEFQARYGLQTDEAKRLYERFGPSSTELDLLMAAKRRVPAL
ncbi:hypothetical protein ASG25_12325 [Rhizobium sp. Leaf384]|jgi:hypothetical protein|uniref:hypothetical protein n=1 Tax=unclassified Rhizobium TaxID=2613769 RepID=UPI000715C628|nr:MULTISPECIES: hypothetical protein [unclassified Rhizobium]KQR68909.1 hypothetical protein ASG03_06625 [Rhizobium sp. Leaf341]KQS79326.1 hypothetical protein ASG25_12325 [Rhizobium sp. Leaf384]KQS82894.1 hypothetical protein ASG58_06140 [Rhizobium sp. Leaf383]